MKYLPLLLVVLTGIAQAVEPTNIVWNSPSKDHRGSMPLGNGDISLNAWVEPSGALVFYIGKTDSWGDNARLLKVGKVRVTLDPPPSINPFRQELSLIEGAMHVRYGDGTTLRVWVDANHPVIHVDATGDRTTTATASLELWRTERYTLPSLESSDVLNEDPKHTPTIVEPDTVITRLTDRVGWYHHNIKSVGPEIHAKIQGMTGYERDDPLLHRTFGAVVTAANANRLDDTHLQSTAGKRHQFRIFILTRHPATPERWLTDMEELIRQTGPTDFEAHKQWWQGFWNRSWIQAKANTRAISRVIAPANNHPLLVGRDQAGGSEFRGEIRKVRTPENIAGDFTLAAEVNVASGATGRIFDKITVGGSDGFLLDILSENTLRLIVGAAAYTTKDVLPLGKWAQVVVVSDTNGWRVSVDGQVVIDTSTTSRGDDAVYVSQMYALQRYLTACAGRGRYPIKFNGSIFTVSAEGMPGDGDYRRWGPGYWWQNTRLPYLSLCTSGDFEMLEPLLRMYVDDLLPLNKYRTKHYFAFDNAAYYIECVQFWGDVFNATYGWQPMADRTDPLQVSGWHKREWVAGPELVWMMLDLYDHTGDEQLLRKRILPTADAVLRCFDMYYKTNDQGQLVMYPSQAVETWWDCTNPMPELAGLHAITARLLALPESSIPAALRAQWKTFAAKLPSLPTRDTPTGKAWAPAEKFADKRNVENPELYAVFPFRLCSFEKDNRELGIQALRHRWDRGDFGWRQDDIFMAYLGLTDEARQYVVGRSRKSDKDSRFPAFWGPNYDWVPDQDHGGVLMKSFQAMLIQTDAEKVFLLPAWPADWDVDFKLHAPQQTTIECEVRDGAVVKLVVTPASRRQDVEVCAPFAAKK